MNRKFVSALLLAGIWLAVSIVFAVWWADAVSSFLPAWYVWVVIIGIALLPGFLMSSMFFSNLMNFEVKRYPDTAQAVTIVLCARDEEKNIKKAIQCIHAQKYKGSIRLIVVDNGSKDETQRRIFDTAPLAGPLREIEYGYCGVPGKSNALNAALPLVRTQYFITVDADTFLEPRAVQRIMNRIVAEAASCVAGNLFVGNGHCSLTAAMQNYDYLLSIAAIKRFQASSRSTLVAQGAFSAYNTEAVRAVGGWEDCLGEDIVLTYKLLQKGGASVYEPGAVGYTMVPQRLEALYNQRKRWAIGMLEGFSHVKPWSHPAAGPRYFAFVNLTVIFLDFTYLFGFIPGAVLACFGYFWFVGWLTLMAMAVSACLYLSVYAFQERLQIPFRDSFWGFVAFMLFFQAIQSTASLHGYLIWITRRKGQWK